MGIGVALASGLVKGFTGNIGREMERRQAEKTRLDTIENAILAAGVGSDFDNKNVAAIKAMLSSSREKAAEQGGIDLFGTRGEDIIPDTAMADLIGQLQSTTEPDVIDSKFIVGKREDGYVFPMDMYADLSVQDAVSAAQELNMKITRDLAAWQNADSETHDAFYKRMNAYGQIIALDVANTPPDREYPDLDAIGWLRAVDTFDNNMRNLRPMNERPNYISAFSSAIKDSKTVPSEDNADYTGSGKVLSLTVPSGFEQQAQDIATNFGAPDWPNTGGNGWWNRYTTTLGEDASYQEAVWETTLKFGKQFSIQPGALQDPVAMNKLSPERAQDMMKYLQNQTGGDLVQMSYVLGAYLKPETFGVSKPNRPFNQRSTTEEEVNTTRLFAARVYISAAATDKDFDKIIERHDAIERVLSPNTGLNAFLELVRNEMTAPPTISKFAKTIETGASMLNFIFGTGGEESGDVVGFSTGGGLRVVSASQASGMGFDAATGTKANSEEEVITSEFITARNTDIRDAKQRANRHYDENGTRLKIRDGGTERDMTREEMASAYARFEAMRISLAFQMARAADPSGRLSNQDVLQQLVRLGGDLDTPEHIEEKVLIAITEFESQRKRYAALMEYASSTSAVTNEAKLFIQGGKVINDLAAKAGFDSASAASSMSGGSQAQANFIFIPTTPNIFEVDGVVYMRLRDGSIQNVDEKTMLDPSNPEDKAFLDQLYSRQDLPPLFNQGLPQGYEPPAVTIQSNPGSSDTTYTGRET